MGGAIVGNPHFPQARIVVWLIEHVYDHGVFDELRAAVRDLAVPVDAAALAELLGIVDELASRVSQAIGEVDAAELWDAEGATSMTAWLRSAGLTAREAARQARTARRLRALPVTSAAWRSGQLSGGQVEAIVSNLTDATVERFDEADLVPLLAPLTVAQTATAMRTWASLVERDEPDEPARRLHVSRTLDGRRELSGSFDAEGGEVIETALRLASDGDLMRTPAERRADALVSVCRWFLDHQSEHPGGRHRPHLNVVVDVADLDRPSVRRLACDANVHRVLTKGRSTILDYGRATRTIPAPLWSALVLRDEHCRFPGCDRPSDWCDGHHVRHWADGGPTSLDNLVLLCNRHHHRCHAPGWAIELRSDGEVVVTRPDGERLRSRPPSSLLAAA